MSSLQPPQRTLRTVTAIVGFVLLAVAVYQNIVLELPYYYTLFSLGMFFLLLSLYNSISSRTLFDSWGARDLIYFTLSLLLVCVLIDKMGLYLGYWEYPHYNENDELRKYIFEWTVALLYHKVSFLIGIEFFRRLKLNDGIAFILSMLVVVTPVGLLTEALNIQVHSWKILDMPLTDLRFGDYFLVFQTIGYWTMALIPYVVYLFFDSFVKERRSLDG